MLSKAARGPIIAPIIPILALTLPVGKIGKNLNC